jgi:hypothetical protein
MIPRNQAKAVHMSASEPRGLAVLKLAAENGAESAQVENASLPECPVGIEEPLFVPLPAALARALCERSLRALSKSWPSAVAGPCSSRPEFLTIGPEDWRGPRFPCYSYWLCG